MHLSRLGASALAAVFLSLAAAPAVAQPPPGSITLPKAMVGPMNEARNAILAKDFGTAKTKLDAAAGIAKTQGEKVAVEQLRLSLVAQMNDHAGTARTIETLLANSAVLTPDDIKRYKSGLPGAYLQMGDNAKYLAASKAFLDEYGGTHQQYASLANDFIKAGDTANGLAQLDKAIASAKAGGSAPESYYRLAMQAHRTANDMPKYYGALEQLIAAYPKEDYWKQSIARSQEAPGFGTDMRLDVYRTLVAAGVKLTAQEKGFMAAEADKRGLPAETVSILQPAFASGELGSSQAEKDALKKATDSAAADKAGLAKEEADTRAKGDGSALAKLGEAFMSHGDNAKAADLIQAGLAKGIPDASQADLAKLHLGIAQYRNGDKAGARATWDAMKGDNAAPILARNWVLVVDVVK